MTRPSDASDPVASPTRPHDPCPPILFFLWLPMLMTVLPGLFATDATAPVAPVRARVDPNGAPWWELTVLPRIGPSTAREIVRYRESVGRTSLSVEENVAFRRPVDLARVRGIGPKTLQRIGPYLHFDDE